MIGPSCAVLPDLFSGSAVFPALLMVLICLAGFNTRLKCMINLKKTKFKHLVNLGFC